MWKTAFTKFEMIFHFKFFKGFFPQILLSTFLNTLSHMFRSKAKYSLFRTVNEIWRCVWYFVFFVNMFHFLIVLTTKMFENVMDYTSSAVFTQLPHEFILFRPLPLQSHIKINLILFISLCVYLSFIVT